MTKGNMKLEQKRKNPTLDNYSDMLTVLELAAVLRIGKNAAYDLVRDGAVASIRVGRKYLVPKICILDFLGATVYHGDVD
jgi:excisionase family DNA binding protein